MPAEDGPHERTWMCWPSSTQVWGEDLVDVQDAIARVAEAIAAFEPVTLLCRQDQVEALRERLADTIDLLPAPVDDLWARDTLPNFLTAADEHDGEVVAQAREVAQARHQHGPQPESVDRVELFAVPLAGQVKGELVRVLGCHVHG